MLTALARYAVVLTLAAAASGCLFETTLDASGGGAMAITLRGIKRKDFEALKGKLQSATVKVTDTALAGDGEGSEARIKIQFDDVTKLATTEFFRNTTVTRSDGSNGTRVLTAIVRHKPGEISDAALQRLGKEVKVVVTFPAPVVESNGTISGGNTVTWTWGMKQFHQLAEIMMTAAYTPPAAPAAPAPTASTPAP